MTEVERRFDELARAVAEKGHTRRGVMKIGLGIVGAALASAFTGRAMADGSSDCAHFCNDAFPPGPERGDCKSAAAHGEGLCVECGADVTRICPRSAPPRCCPPRTECCGTKACCKVRSQICCPLQNMCCPRGTVCSDQGCLTPCGADVCPPGATCCEDPATGIAVCCPPDLRCEIGDAGPLCLP